MGREGDMKFCNFQCRGTSQVVEWRLGSGLLKDKRIDA
jgi:hypothetical protein